VNTNCHHKDVGITVSYSRGVDLGLDLFCFIMKLLGERDPVALINILKFCSGLCTTSPTYVRVVVLRVVPPCRQQHGPPKRRFPTTLVVKTPNLAS
jgi:hypothetical protein